MQPPWQHDEIDQNRRLASHSCLDQGLASRHASACALRTLDSISPAWVVGVLMDCGLLSGGWFAIAVA